MSASPRAALLLFVCSLCCGPPTAWQAAAQSVESFYKGRTVTMLVGTSPGGINDISARLVARHLWRFIAGNPNIIVQNNPGGGGLVTANRLYFNSDKDGSVLAKLERAVPQLSIQGHPNAQFDPAKFTWHLIFAVIAKEVLGLNVNVVRGYTGAAPLFLAMQRGELDGQMVGLSSVRTGQRDLWTRGAFRPLMAFGRTRRHAAFPDMPIGRELAGDPSALSLIEFAELPFFMALPFAAPPDVPPDRAKALQTAFMAMCRDKAFVEEVEKLGIDLSPIDGDAILILLARTAATPSEVIAHRRHAERGDRALQRDRRR